MPKKKKETVKEEPKPLEEPFNYGALIFFVGVVLLSVFSLGKFGTVGNFFNNVFSYIAGPSYIVLLISLLIVGFIEVFLKKKYVFNIWFYIGLILLNLAVFLLSAYIINSDNQIFDFNSVWQIIKSLPMVVEKNADFKGGVIGTLLLAFTNKAFDVSGTVIILVVLFALSMIFIVPLGVYKTVIKAMRDSSAKAANALKEKHENKVNEKHAQFIEVKNNQKLEKKREEKRKLELAEKMNDSYKESITPEVTNYEQVPIEEVENISEFTKTYFIKDDLAKQKKVVADSEPKDEQAVEIKKTRRKSGAYHLPPLNLLTYVSGKPSSTNRDSAAIKGKQLIETLATFDIDAELINTHIGPSVTKFEVRPDANIKINRIINIQDNIKMQLAVKDIRIEAPIPGRSAVGIEIPNAQKVMVRMSELVKDVPLKYKSSPLAFTLGKDLMGKPVYCELNKMPHLLIAGATGSGKSVCINTIIISYLLKTNPDDVKLVLIDPKKVEFSPYHDIPHLLWPVITDTNMASLMLKKAVVIMEDRYEKFADVGVRDIASFNEFVERHNANLKEGESAMNKLPYIVIIIDELADLMAVAKKDVEMSIQRLTQLSRACGMHMIVATQRPSTDVITGLIKSNIPSRISFAVSSSIDSRTILDSIGAEKLLGNGDMLYMPQGENAPIRIQGCFVDDKEIANITDYVKKQASPEYEDSYFEIIRASDGSSSFAYSGEGGNTKDPLYDEVIEFVKDVQKASTSLLQRKFGIGYNRSARIIDQLEENGIIGPANGSKPREVYVKKDDE